MRRSPHGERGLKYQLGILMQENYLSLSSRRAWIEIKTELEDSNKIKSRSPHGERGLK